MSDDRESAAELPRLLSALEDGTLNEVDEARLAVLLRTDPAARAKFYEYVMLSALLRREGRRAAAGEQTAEKPPVPAPAVSIRRAAWRGRAWQLAAAASALLALVLSVSEATGVTRLVPTIIRVVTGEGSLVIEVDDPSVSVTLDGEDITISGAGIHELRLRPGPHKFVTTKGGKPLREEVVTIERGGRQIVKVSREAGFAAVADAAAKVFRGHTAAVWSVAFTPDGKHIVSAAHDGSVQVWNIASGQVLHRLDGHDLGIWSVAISPDGRRVLSGGGGRPGSQPDTSSWSICLWELESGKQLNRLAGEQDWVTSVSFSEDGQRALFGMYGGAVVWWDLEQWREIKRFQTAKGLWSARFSPDGIRVVTAAGHESELDLCIWNLTNGGRVQRLLGPERGGMWQAMYLPGGRQIVSAGNDNIRVWDLETGKSIQRFSTEFDATSLAVSTDGKHLISGNFGADVTVRLWSLKTGKELRGFAGHTHGVQTVAISRDGRWAASGSHDHTVRVWALPAEVQQKLPKHQ